MHWGRCFLPGGARSCLGGAALSLGVRGGEGAGPGTREVSRGWQWPPRLRSGGERGQRGLALWDREAGQGCRLQADPARWGPGGVVRGAGIRGCWDPRRSVGLAVCDAVVLISGHQVWRLMSQDPLPCMKGGFGGSAPCPQEATSARSTWRALFGFPLGSGSWSRCEGKGRLAEFWDL